MVRACMRAHDAPKQVVLAVDGSRGGVGVALARRPQIQIYRKMEMR